MDKEKHGNGEGFFAGFLVGGLLAAGLALILEDKDKKRLKRIFKNKGKVLFGVLEGAVREGRERAEKTKTQALKEAGEVVSSSSSRLRRFFTRGGKELS